MLKILVPATYKTFVGRDGVLFIFSTAGIAYKTGSQWMHDLNVKMERWLWTNRDTLRLGSMSLQYKERTALRCPPLVLSHMESSTAVCLGRVCLICFVSFFVLFFYLCLLLATVLSCTILWTSKLPMWPVRKVVLSRIEDMSLRLHPWKFFPKNDSTCSCVEDSILLGGQDEKKRKCGSLHLSFKKTKVFLVLFTVEQWWTQNKHWKIDVM